MTKSKILTLDELSEKVKKLRASGHTVVQSHGIFDLIHPGIIRHLESAKAEGDMLVVTVIRDSDVRRGPGRPIFEDKMRAEAVAGLGMVDYVAIVSDETPFECVKRVKPDVFAKGEAFKERDRIVHRKIFEEEKQFYFGKARIHETCGFSESSTKLINSLLDIYPDETREFLNEFGSRYPYKKIEEKLNRLSGLDILLVGDGIIDEYHYCRPMSKSAKAHLVVNRYLNHEIFAGGAFAIANHLSGICGKIHLVTALGAEEAREEFVRDHLLENITPKLFFRPDGPTIVKKRYINQYLNQKLFEINYINDEFIPEETEAKILSHLEKEIPKHDIVLVSDFGHGLITKKIISLVARRAKAWAVNTQTNGANAGYNLITKYKGPDYVCLDEPEVRLAAQEKFEDIEPIARKIAKETKAKTFMVTLGRNGSICLQNGGRKVNRTPVFSSKVIDTVGAGDAFFAFTAPCVMKGYDIDLVSFIGNAVGALAVQIVGNKKPVTKYELLNFIYTLLK